MKAVRVHLDAQVNFHPGFDMPRFLLAALDHMPRVAPTDLRVVCLAERSDGSFFQSLAQDEIRLPGDRWRTVAWDAAGGVKIRHLPDHRDIWILAGRQIAAAEGLDVCALGSDAPIADGLSVRETIRAILAAGGLPAVGWAPGQWFSRCAPLARELMAEFPPRQLVLIDTALRPLGWPAPRLHAAARRQGRAVLAGSALLPAAGEESLAGSYYCTFSMPPPADPARLVGPLLTVLASESLPMVCNGRRGSPAAVLGRLGRLRARECVTAATVAAP